MKYYSLKIAVRIGLLTIVLTLTLLAFMDDRFLFNRFILLVILSGIIAELFWFLHYTNRQLTLFIESLKNQDYSIHFPKKGSGMIRHLNENFQEVIHSVKENMTHEQGQQQFLQTAFDQLNTGLLSIAESGEIRLMNKKAQELLGTNRMHSLEALRRIHPNFVEYISSPDTQDVQILELAISSRPVTLSIRTSRIRQENTLFQIIAFLDIREALDAKEIDSWTRLIRILTHEIMNSVTPIASLSESMYQQLPSGKEEITPITTEQIQDLTYSLKTIHRRSEGLLSFVEDYRKFTRVGTPEKQDIRLDEFIQEMRTLFQEELNQNNITLGIEISSDTCISADRILLEQALINILRNAIDAISGKTDGKILIHHEINGGYDQIRVTDNGIGIPGKELKEAFVPFFTTKKEGSGIGLSLARHILHAHGGTIHLESIVKEGTSCTLFLPSSDH